MMRWIMCGMLFAAACKSTQPSGVPVEPVATKEVKFNFTSDANSSGLFLASKPQTITIDLAVMPDDKKPSTGSANVAFCAGQIGPEVSIGNIACVNPKEDAKVLRAKHVKQKCSAAKDSDAILVTPNEGMPISAGCKSAKIEILGFQPPLQVVMEAQK